MLKQLHRYRFHDELPVQSAAKNKLLTSCDRLWRRFSSDKICDWSLFNFLFHFRLSRITHPQNYLSTHKRINSKIDSQDAHVFCPGWCQPMIIPCVYFFGKLFWRFSQSKKRDFYNLRKSFEQIKRHEILNKA